MLLFDFYCLRMIRFPIVESGFLSCDKRNRRKSKQKTKNRKKQGKNQNVKLQNANQMNEMELKI